MTRTRCSFLCLLALAAAAIVTAGCGSSSYKANGPTNTVSGATTQVFGTCPATTVPATGGVTAVATVSGQSVGVTIPSGATSPTAGQTVAVLDKGSSLLSGTFTAAASVTVNGVTSSGVTVDATGALLQNVALPVAAGSGTAYTLVFPAGSVHGRSLTVASMTLAGKFYYVSGSVISPVPTAISGVIPNNGEDPSGSHVLATFGVGNVGRSANLKIYYTSNHTSGLSISQTVTIDSSNQASFTKLSNNGGSGTIPSSGIDSIVLTIGDLS